MQNFSLKNTKIIQKTKDRLLKSERRLFESLDSFEKLYEISHNSEKLFITLSSAILVASFSFIKLLPNANFKIFLLISWLSFTSGIMIIIWNQIHYRAAFTDKELFKSLYFLKKLGNNEPNQILENNALENYNIAITNISISLNNAQLLFITGILFILGFSTINFDISNILINPIMIFLGGWILILMKLLRKPKMYKNA